MLVTWTQLAAIRGRDDSPQSRRGDESSEAPQPPKGFKYYFLITKVMNVTEPSKFKQANEHKEWRDTCQSSFWLMKFLCFLPLVLKNAYYCHL